VPPAASFGGHGRVQILLDIAWLLLMLVKVSPQTSMPSSMSPLPYLFLASVGPRSFDLLVFYARAVWLL